MRSLEMKNGSRFNVEVAHLKDAESREQQVCVAFEQCQNLGTKPDANVTDLWLPAIAPSRALVNWFHYDEDKWYEFERRYRGELLTVPTPCEQLRSLACRTVVLLVYMNGSVRRNAAVVLKKHLIELECQRRWDAGWMVGGHTSPVRNEIEHRGGLWFGSHKV